MNRPVLLRASCRWASRSRCSSRCSPSSPAPRRRSRPAVASADSTIRLTLGEAVRLAAKQNAGVESARFRVAGGRRRASRSAAPISCRTSPPPPSERRATLNSAAAFPVELPMPGIDPRGSVLGPLDVFDARARVTQSAVRPGGPRPRAERAHRRGRGRCRRRPDGRPGRGRRGERVSRACCAPTRCTARGSRIRRWPPSCSGSRATSSPPAPASRST